MIQTSKPHVGLTYVLNFSELDKKIRFEQARAEQVFGVLVNGQSQQTNLSDEFDPAQPRIVFPSEKKSISISQIACQLTLNFSGSGLKFANELDVGKKNIDAFWKQALEFKSVNMYGSHGLVLDLRYPSSDSPASLSGFIHERFIKIAPIGEPAACNLQVGYKYEGLFMNLTCNSYETRKLPDSNSQGFVRIETFPVVESGIQVRIDVNNLPDFEHGGNANAPVRLMTATEKFLSENFETVFGLPMP